MYIRIFHGKGYFLVKRKVGWRGPFENREKVLRRVCSGEVTSEGLRGLMIPWQKSIVKKFTGVWIKCQWGNFQSKIRGRGTWTHPNSDEVRYLITFSLGSQNTPTQYSSLHRKRNKRPYVRKPRTPTVRHSFGPRHPSVHVCEVSRQDE